MQSSQVTHALVTPRDHSQHRSIRDGVRYCTHCGAQTEGKGAWGHDNDCPQKK